MIQTKKTDNIPQLRFPEFEGEWEKKKLGKVFKISAGGDIGSENVSELKNDKFQYPIYANAEKNKGFYGYSNIYKIEENVVTVAGRGVNIGIAHARNHKFYPIVRLLVLKPISNENIYFFEYQINNLNLLKESTGVPQLTAPQISGYEIFYPTLPEQTKIATFLTAVDEKLQALKKKKSLLQAYKKGVMQKLFSITAETHGRAYVRFKDEDGKPFPKWEMRKLGEVCEIKKGEQLNKEDLTETGSYPCLNGGINFSGYTEKFNSEENTITISEGGNSCGYINFMTSKFWLGGHCYKIVLPHKICIGYFYQLLKFNERRIMDLRVGSRLPNIQQKDLRNFELEFCNSLEEQTHIANFLSSIDKKINHAQTQITQTQQWKKGLLQRMFV